jgi:hypothetical protein
MASQENRSISNMMRTLILEALHAEGSPRGLPPNTTATLGLYLHTTLWWPAMRPF